MKAMVLYLEIGTPQGVTTQVLGVMRQLINKKEKKFGYTKSDLFFQTSLI